MQVASYLSIIRRRAVFLLIIPAVLGAIAFVYADSRPSVYESATSLLVRNVAPVPIDPNTVTNPADPTETPLTVALNDLLTNDRIMATYTELATHRVVLQQVISALGLPYSEAELRGKIEAEHLGNTQLLTITAEDEDPALAAAIANQTAAAFMQQSDAEFGEVGTVAVAEEAVPSTTAVSPNVTQAVLLAVVLGLFIAGLVVLLFEYSDDRLRSRDDILASAGLPTLAVIGRSRNVRRLRAGESTTLEDYRELRASVRKLSDEFGLRSILIAGYGRGNGRTMTALNLSLVLADIGESVILVDADFRQPSLHNLTGTPNDFGLSDLLKRAYDPNEWPLFVVDGGIDVLPSGPPPESLSVLSSSNMEELLGELKSTADVVILDSPALSAVSDAFDLARFADGTIIVVESGKTQADNLRTMATMLAERGARVLGVVLNKGRSPRASQRRYRERRNEAGSSAKRGSKPAEEPLRRERGSALPSVIATNGHASNDARSPDSSPAATKGVPALEAEQTHPGATQTVLPADTEPARAPKPRARGSQARPVLPAVNGEQPPN